MMTTAPILTTTTTADSTTDMYDYLAIRRRTLYKAKPENVVRLARFLKLNVDGMSHRQTCRLVAWRLSRHRMYG